MEGLYMITIFNYLIDTKQRRFKFFILLPREKYNSLQMHNSWYFLNIINQF